jgi:hypothetical protein
MTCDVLKTTHWTRTRTTSVAAAETDITELMATRPVDLIGIESYRGARFRFYSTEAAGADTSVVTFYGVDPIGGPGGSGGWFATALGTVTIDNWSTEVGVTGTMFETGWRFADTGTWTPDAFGTAILVYVTGNIAFEDRSGNIGELLVSDFGGFNYVTWRLTTDSIGTLINSVHKLNV